MSYQGPKPFGRRRTDKPLSEDDRLRLQMIRRDVDDDPTGMIRRYLRLASKAFEDEQNEDCNGGSSFSERRIGNPRKHQAA